MIIETSNALLELVLYVIPLVADAFIAKYYYMMSLFSSWIFLSYSRY